MDFHEAQHERFLKAYDIARRALMDLKIFPAKNEAQEEGRGLGDGRIGDRLPDDDAVSTCIDIAGFFLANCGRRAGNRSYSGRQRFTDPNEAKARFVSGSQVQSQHREQSEGVTGKPGGSSGRGIFDNMKSSLRRLIELIRSQGQVTDR